MSFVAIRRMCMSELQANDFRHHALDQRGICLDLGVFVRVLIECQYATGDRIAGGVVTSHNQQNQVALILERVVHHVLRFGIGGQQADEVHRVWRVVFALTPQLS